MNGNRESVDYLNDILSQIDKIKKFVSGASYEQFADNEDKNLCGHSLLYNNR